MARFVKAWGWWVAGMVTVLVALYVLSRRLHETGTFLFADDGDDELADEPDE